MRIFLKKRTSAGLSAEEIKKALLASIEGRKLKKVLLIPPDFTRYHSNAGYITNVYYHALKDRCEVDIMPALGTHFAMEKEECEKMFGDIPFERFIEHRLHDDVVTIGTVPGEYLSKITEGIWSTPVPCQVNKRLVDDGYDLIISIGQVVPHEVVGMANHSKNIFVGCGGSEFINKSHMIGALYGMERIMGKDRTPPRKLFDYCLTHFMADREILFVLTVTTVSGGKILTHGLFIGEERIAFERAVALARKTNLDIVEKPFKKCVVYLDPSEFRSTWLGNKAIYRTRMAIADGGELIVLAPGVRRFGEDEKIDGFIGKYGYIGRKKVLETFETNEEMQKNEGAAAHLIHGSPDGRFKVIYAVKNISKEKIASVGFIPADYDETVKLYDPTKLKYGYNVMTDGEEIYYIPNPALGLWISKDKL